MSVVITNIFRVNLLPALTVIKSGKAAQLVANMAVHAGLAFKLMFSKEKMQKKSVEHVTHT